MQEAILTHSTDGARSIDLHPLRVTLHQGHQSIGGALYEVSHRNGHRVILDLGLPLYESPGQAALNLDWARLARDPVAGLAQLRRRGIPPPGLGLFQDELPRLCDGIFITHAHLDHWGLLPFLRDGLKVYAHPTTRRLIQWQCLWQGVALPCLDWHDLEPEQSVRPFHATKLSDFYIYSNPVDHSVPGALSLELSCGWQGSHRRLVYSGDLRFGEDLEERMNYAANFCRKTDLLLVEGTHLTPGHVAQAGPDEAQVAAAVQRALTAHAGLVSVQASALHQVRLAQLRWAARQSGRTLVLDLYAALARKAAGCSLRGMRVLFTKDYMRRIEERRRQFPELAEALMGAEALQDCQTRRVRLAQIQAEPGAWLLGLRAGLLKDFDRYAAQGWARLPRPDLHIHSLWKGYRRPDDTLERWLSSHGVPVLDSGVHASGHAHPEQLRRWALAHRAEHTVVVHSAHPAAWGPEFRPASVLTSRRRYASQQAFERRGFTLRDWVAEQVKVFGKDVGLVRKRALRRGYLDEEVEGAFIALQKSNTTS